MNFKLKILFLGLLLVLCVNSVSAADSLNNMTLNDDVLLDGSDYVVGETISPAIYDDDCIIAISGSGETNTIVSAARIAKNRGSKVLAVTSYPESTLGQLADGHLLVKGRTKKEVDDQNYMKRQIYGNYTSLTPLGTAFELTTLVFLDAIVSELMEKMHQTESDLKSRHTVLE